jgi:thiol-disulfide isomerase/thioredoxin
LRISYLMRTVFVTIFLLCCFLTQAQSQTIKKWKVEQLVNYIRNNDSTLVINFWATWCKPCIEELPYFHRIAKKYSGDRVKLLLVSLDLAKDYPKGILEFAKKNNYDAQIIWLDETNADHFCPQIDSTWSGALPSTLIFDKKHQYKKFYEGQVKPEKLEAEIRTARNLVTYPEAIPHPVGYINDFEKLFSNSQLNLLDSLIKSHEKKTTDQIALVTIKSIVPYSSLSGYSFDLARSWGVGQKEKNNGVVIVFCTQLRQIWIQNGLGIEKRLSNAQTQQIIKQYFLPDFREENFYEGCRKGLMEITRVLEGS